MIWFPLALNIEASFSWGRAVSTASLLDGGVIHLLKNDRAGFRVFSGPYNRQLQTAGNVPEKDKVEPCVESVAFWRQSLPLLLMAVLFLAGTGQLNAQVSRSYRVDTKESRIEIHLFKGGFLSSLGDNHLITLTAFSGTADLSTTNPWKAELSGKSASLKVIDPWGNPSERKDVQTTMLGPQQLDVQNFPLIALHSVSFDPTGKDTDWHLQADVTLHGVTRKVQFSLNCHQTGDRLRISGKKMFKLTEFNIQPFSTAFGAVKVKNDFEVTFNIVLDRIH